jgi:putative hydrolase
MKKLALAADLHVHTVSSGHAYSTVEEYVERAKKIGLEAFALTDHGPKMPGGPHYYYFSNLRMIPDIMNGVRIFKGAECNIVNEDGALDLPDDILKNLDIVMAAFHPRVGYESMGEERNTEVLLKVIKNPYVNVIAHPGNPMFPVSIKKIVAAAKDRGIALEINNSSFTGSRTGSWDRCLEFAREIKRQNWVATIGSDSHMSTMLGTFDKAIELVKLAGLKKENIVNSSISLINKYLVKLK